MPRAPFRSTSSSSGDRMAASAASRARLSPAAAPVPIIAMPISDITVRTSAKSTLIIPGRMIRSAMPWTAPSSTSFAAANASSTLVFSPSTSKSFSFGIVISESTCAASSLMPCSALLFRFSKSNGLVTTATVRMPSSLATSATTGAAPVPVPPPMPAVTKTMSEPLSSSAMRSRSSSAAARPMSGFAPAPSPLVTLLPICIVVCAANPLRAWASVLVAIKSTPLTCLETMCSTAFPPPPPTPITFITALWGALSTSSNIVFSC